MSKKPIVKLILYGFSLQLNPFFFIFFQIDQKSKENVILKNQMKKTKKGDEAVFIWLLTSQLEDSNILNNTQSI